MVKQMLNKGLAQASRGPWPTVLVTMAAAGRADGGLGLQHLLERAGFTTKPTMTMIVKRPRTKSLDPAVDDVLDALRALCITQAA